MKLPYITIEREYGSGGTEIGRRLAQECGIPCYGREILEEVARCLDTTVDQIEKYEESVTGSLLYSIFMISQMESGNSDILTGESRIFLEEQAVIQKLADQGSAIFLGHCASKALEKRENVLKVFIYADTDKKRERIQKEYGISSGKSDAFMKKFDKKRANYYLANTREKWDNLRNYDITLDSGTLGIERCVDVLKGLF